ncbi:RagB/SusD family nutrient uptake outer membrane protein [Dyadobacter tibetensis]|uniref:RagB/SusD family nutrient uptake outer membrane protein n=1 Tax=Dyadobacter tibetensis TaxID=1211851 RepID=UPI00046E6663|nr:RagB/SusD family nutrient uptake outer membrane protein [Dyadobacter tibetensis]
MKKKIILACLVGLASTSCQENFLSLTPETSLSSATFFKTRTDFEQAVNATYVPLRTIYNDRAWKLGELHSDNTYYARNILFGAVDNTENIADFAVPTANGVTANDNVLQQWRQDYLIISRANQILALIDGVEFDAAIKANLKGQAQFLRAFAYFELARYFGSVPLHLEPVPNRDQAALPLSTVEEVYAQIEKDAKDAVANLLPKSTQEAGRATSGAARTLLANLYIHKKQWAEAETVLKQVIDSGEYSLMPSYEDAFSGTSSNKNNAESVFEIQYMEGASGFQGNLIYQIIPTPITSAELVAITGTSNPQGLSGENNNIPTPDIIEAYEPGDVRKDASIGYITLSQSLRDNKVYPYIKKYAKKHSQHNNTGQNLPAYRYAEVLLFMAEALNEQNKPAQAATYLNMVRTRAKLPATTATSQVAMRQAIYQERRVELAFENKRWFDLVRTDRVQEVISAYGKRVKANPKAYYFPDGAVPPENAFTVLDKYYGLPAVESALSPYF